MKMTKEIRERIERNMDEVCGGNWCETAMTEEQFDEVCGRCPYCGKCRDMGIMWGCPNWEESMGEDI